MKDLLNIMQKLKQKARVSSTTISKDLVYKEMSKDAILNLLLDCFGMDSLTNEVSLSMINLSTRYEERSKLEE